jgi:hypothetical protein
VGVAGEGDTSGDLAQSRQRDRDLVREFRKLGRTVRYFPDNDSRPDTCAITEDSVSLPCARGVRLHGDTDVVGEESDLIGQSAAPGLDKLPDKVAGVALVADPLRGGVTYR